MKEEQEMKKIENPYQEDLLLLSSSLSKLLKRRFGKGPETCYITMHASKLVIHIRNFITPAEDVLLKSKKRQLAHTFRASVMETVFKEFSQEAIDTLGIPFNYYLQDWNFEQNSALLLMENRETDEWIDSFISPLLKEKIFQLMTEICAEVHKQPTSMEIIKAHPNLYVIKSTGVLLQVEKMLVTKGHEDLLNERTAEIKESYLRHATAFQELFESKVEDLFIMWDYIHDRSYCFIYI